MWLAASSINIDENDSSDPIFNHNNQQFYDSIKERYLVMTLLARLALQSVEMSYILLKRYLINFQTRSQRNQQTATIMLLEN